MLANECNLIEYRNSRYIGLSTETTSFHRIGKQKGVMMQ